MRLGAKFLDHHFQHILNNMAVLTLQQQEQNLRIQKAYRKQYSIAKRIRNWRLTISYIIAFGFPIISFTICSGKNSSLKAWLAVGASVWAFSAFWLNHYEKKCFKLGAQLQDLFDVRIFSLDWNKILVSDEPSQETINNLSERFKGKVDENWYGNLQDIPAPYDVVISQRSNVVWDWRLRQQYIILIIIALVALLIVQTCVSLAMKLLLSDFMLAIFLPSLSAYTAGIRELFEHHDNIKGKQSIEKKITTLLLDCVKTRQKPDKVTIRQIQDAIYILRKCPATIPDFFWKWRRNKYNKMMQMVINDYRDQIDNNLK